MTRGGVASSVTKLLLSAQEEAGVDMRRLPCRRPGRGHWDLGQQALGSGQGLQACIAALRTQFPQPGKAEKLPVCLRFTLPRQRCGLNV